MAEEKAWWMGLGWLPPLLTAATSMTAVLAGPSLRRLRPRVTWLLLVLALGIDTAWGLFGRPTEPGADLAVLAVAALAGRLLALMPRRAWVVLLVVLGLADVASFALAVQTRPVPPTLVGPSTLANVLLVWPGGHWREGLVDVALTVALALRLRVMRPLLTTILWLLGASLAPFAVSLAGVHGGVPLVPFYAAAALLGERSGRTSARSDVGA
ncbi:MAG: hypothetical protein K6V97_09105 [Actinomycetia bacterium]|nr:hypothetical protein [Actinomycetes bacterium]